MRLLNLTLALALVSLTSVSFGLCIGWLVISAPGPGMLERTDWAPGFERNQDEVTLEEVDYPLTISIPYASMYQ